MALSCGCQPRPGVAPTEEEKSRHLAHTFETMIYWELLLPRPPEGQRAAELRIEYIEALRKAYDVKFPDM